MKSSNTNLQYVFACFATHSKWVQHARKDLNIIIKAFNLAKNEIHQLKIFLNDNGQRLFISAFLAEEKRWREMLTVINYTINVVSLNKLKVFWKQYLDKILLNQTIPASPLEESVRFLQFLLTHKFDLISRDTIIYESLKNTCLMFKDDELNNINIKPSLSYLVSNSHNISVKLNPSFDYRFVTKNILNVFLSNNKNDTVSLQKMLVGVYKHPLTNSVKTINLNRYQLSILLKIKRWKMIKNWFNDDIINAKCHTQKSLIDLAYKLHTSGLIILSNVGELSICL